MLNFKTRGPLGEVWLDEEGEDALLPARNGPFGPADPTAAQIASASALAAPHKRIRPPSAPSGLAGADIAGRAAGGALLREQGEATRAAGMGELYGFSPEELEAMALGRELRQVADYAEAAKRAGAAIAGVKPETSANERARKEADRPLAEVQRLKRDRRERQEDAQKDFFTRRKMQGFDATSAISRVAQDVARRLLPELGEFVGDKSYMDLEGAMKEYADLFRAQVQERMNTADNASAERRAALGARAGGSDYANAWHEANAIRRDELNFRRGERTMDGWTPKDPNKVVPLQQVNKFTDENFHARNLFSFLDELDRVYAETGPEAFPTAARARLGGFIENVRQSGNKLNGNGVMNDGDYESMKLLYGDPNGLVNFANDETFREQVRGARQRTYVSLKNRADALGLVEDGTFTYQAVGGGRRQVEASGKSRKAPPAAQQAPQGKKLVSKQYYPKVNKTVLRYSDGSEEAVDGRQ